MNNMSKFFTSAAASCNSKFYTTDSVAAMPEWIKSGLKDAPYYCEEKNATFGGRNNVAPEKMPDFSKHSNFMTDFLQHHPEIYDKLKHRKTKNGVTLIDCIKTGVDNPGHPHIKTCGIVAGDEESYEVFKELFDPIIAARHGGYGADGK
jgi:creatine kinase